MEMRHTLEADGFADDAFAAGFAVIGASSSLSSIVMTPVPPVVRALVEALVDV